MEGPVEGNADGDEELMADVAAGWDERLEPLVRRHADALLRFLERMTRDRHRAEELFQETWLAVWRGRRGYDPESPFRAWLYRIALNKCREAGRRRREPVVANGERSPGERAASGNPSPAQSAATSEAAARAVDALDRLPPRQRAVTVMRIYGGLSLREIAEATGRGEGTARANLHHALRRLRRELDGEPG